MSKENYIAKTYTKYDSYGVDRNIPWQNIKAGDAVVYQGVTFRKKKSLRITLYGVWDGEKVEFDDKEKHVIRTTRWLTKT